MKNSITSTCEQCEAEIVIHSPLLGQQMQINCDNCGFEYITIVMFAPEGIEGKKPAKDMLV